jgi:hypothetical protein
MEENPLVQTTSPSFRVLRSFLCDSEKTGLLLAFTTMLCTLSCHETIILLFVRVREGNRKDSIDRQDYKRCF